MVADADWYDALLGADTWWKLHEVAPRKAALLLHGCDPLDEQPGLEASTSDETQPEHFKRLELAFEDLARHRPQPRTLAEWVGFARQSGLHYHSWVDQYARARAIAIPGVPASVAATTPASSPSSTPAPPPASMSSGAAGPASPPAPTPASVVVLVPVRVQTHAPEPEPTGGQRQRARWTDQRLQALWDDSKRFGCSQEQLACKYGVSRQRISVLLKQAEERFSARRASPFPFSSAFKGK